MSAVRWAKNFRGVFWRHVIEKFKYIDTDTLINSLSSAVGPLGAKFDFFSPLGFESKRNFDYKTFQLKQHSIRASERYLKDKNPIHRRETASIFRFDAETSESDFKLLELP